MSTKQYDERTATDRPQLDYHAIAARLTVDAEELRLLVQNHPNPTAPVVLGWAKADPQHREAVERWLVGRETAADARADELGDEIDDTAHTPYRSLKEGGR